MDPVIFEDLESSTSDKEFESLEKYPEEPESPKVYKSVLFEINIEPVNYAEYAEESNPKIVQHTYELFGEDFILEKEDNKIILSHNEWSLYSEGKNLLEAETNLITEAKEIAEVFLEIPASSLDPNALKLRDFLFRII